MSSDGRSAEDSSGASGAGGRSHDSEDERHDIILRKGRHSCRNNFFKKVLSPVIGYSEEYELLHFAYDLCMWSTLGGWQELRKGHPTAFGAEGSVVVAGVLARSFLGPR